MKDLAGIIGFLALLPLVVGGVRWLSVRFGLPPEVRRKAVHVGMGASSLAFPWIFDSVLAVALLGALCLGLLTLIRRREARQADNRTAVLYGVERASLGDVWFPLAVTIVFALARRHEGVEGILLFVIPILILTVADAAGALVGTRYGEHRFSCLSGWKSAEGCFSFFIAAFLSVHIPLLLFSEVGRTETLLIAAILGFTVTLFEGISVRGIDNLVVPVASALLLDRFLPMDADALVWRLLVVVVLLVFVLSCSRWSTLEGGALLAAVLFGYGCCALGDWRFLIPPLILFAEHIYITRRILRLQETRHDLTPVLAIGLSLLPWPLLASLFPGSTEPYLVAFIVGTATHLAIANTGTRAFLARRFPTLRMAFLGWLKGVVLVGLPGVFLTAASSLPVSTIAGFAAGSATMLGAALLFGRRVCRRDGWEDGDFRWWWQALFSLTAAGSAWLAFLLTRP